MNKPATVLVVLDGWGIAPASAANAIHVARTPHWDRLWASPSATKLEASGVGVGLPGGQMGNSEVGHMTLGAGRILPQDLRRINDAIRDGQFANNRLLNDTIEASRGGKLHVLGLLSPGGVHSHEKHIAALLDLARRPGVDVRLHAFLDGRDTPPRSAGDSLRRLEDQFPNVVASLCGRYYAMDRDERWSRTERAYDMLQGVPSHRFNSPGAALEAAYERGESDEFAQPTAVCRQREGPVKLEDGDAVVFMNFRADRARQLCRALLQEDFTGFSRRSRTRFSAFATLTKYADDIHAPAAFGTRPLVDTLGWRWVEHGLSQLRLAETEKYAHVTYFFSGGYEQPFAGEDRILVPSPKVDTYDLSPAMSAVEVTDRLTAAIDLGSHDAIVCNYANGDMVGHTGVFEAAVQAVEVVDDCLGRLVRAPCQDGLAVSRHRRPRQCRTHGRRRAGTHGPHLRARSAGLHRAAPRRTLRRRRNTRRRGADDARVDGLAAAGGHDRPISAGVKTCARDGLRRFSRRHAPICRCSPPRTPQASSKRWSSG